MSSFFAQKALSPCLYGLRRYQKRWSHRAESKAWIAVLCYHRIVAKSADNQGLFGVERGLTAATFEAQMRFMLQHFMPIKAHQIADYQHRQGCYFAVTFDDGYADNFTVAAPILRQMNLSATFFVTYDTQKNLPNSIDAPANLFWWEALAQMLRLTPLHYLFIDTIFPEWTDRQLCSINLVLTDYRSKAHSFNQLSTALLRTPARDIQQYLIKLAQALQVEMKQLKRELPLMSMTQLNQLQQQGFDIGGHTASHANLGLVNDAERQTEILHATQQLSAQLEQPLISFAYPYGQPSNYNSAARSAVMEAGYKNAFTTSKRLITDQDDLYTLPRIKLNQPYGFACAHTIEKAFQDTMSYQQTLVQSTASTNLSTSQ